MGTPDPVKIILFDGVCNLCNGSVQFVIKRDPKSKFRFAALQSPFGQEQLRKYGLPADQLYSVMLIEDDKVFQKSTAALKIARALSGGWPLLYAFMALPPFIRNWFYDWIAANRYKWFGKREVCMIPTSELKTRFIE